MWRASVLQSIFFSSLSQIYTFCLHPGVRTWLRSGCQWGPLTFGDMLTLGIPNFVCKWSSGSCFTHRQKSVCCPRRLVCMTTFSMSKKKKKNWKHWSKDRGADGGPIYFNVEKSLIKTVTPLQSSVRASVSVLFKHFITFTLSLTQSLVEAVSLNPHPSTEMPPNTSPTWQMSWVLLAMSLGSQRPNWQVPGQLWGTRVCPTCLPSLPGSENACLKEQMCTIQCYKEMSFQNHRTTWRHCKFMFLSDRSLKGDTL